jgi:glycosyltransferase involved in cell wall biosynthesis
MPTFSIITVCYNPGELLKITMDSIRSQSCSDFEYLVIDGNSKDGTQSLIKENQDLITSWISEPDRGLYDAMNKGLRQAKGDFVWFVNAGDSIFHSDTLLKLKEKITSNTDVLFGEVMLVNDERKELGTRSELTTQKLPNVLNAESLKYGMVVSHQGFLPSRKIAPSYLADNLCADIDWVIYCLKRSRENVRLEEPVAHYLTGGLSKKRHRQSLKDRFWVLRRHYGLGWTLWAHFVILIRGVFHKISRIGKEDY